MKYLIIKDDVVFKIFEKTTEITPGDVDFPFSTIVIDKSNSYQIGDDFDIQDFAFRQDYVYPYKNLIDMERYKK